MGEGVTTSQARSLLDDASGHVRRAGDEPGAAPCRKVLLALGSDPQILELARRFQERKIIPSVAFSLTEVLDCVSADTFAAVVVAREAAKGSTEDLVRRTRAASEAPVLVVGEVPSPLLATVDEYAAPDASEDEIFSRAMTLVELSRPVGLPEPLRWGRLALDVRRKTASWNGDALELTALQFRILEVLVLAGGGMVTPAELSRRVWGDPFFGDRDRVVAHIRRIRKLIEPDPARPRFLLTVRGQGFRLADSAPEAGILSVS